jgi:molybdenum cofactor cytidylyltransferase
LIAPERIAAVVLAAGTSSRFGADKLLHPLNGKPLAAHAADILVGLPFAYRFAVVPSGNEARAEIFANRRFDLIPNSDPRQGLSSSLALGAGMAAALGVDGLLLALADMPFVTRSHLSLLIGAAGKGPVATEHNGVKSPPAIFPSEMFADLMALDGDRGARPLLEGAFAIQADAAMVRDIDTLGDLGCPATPLATRPAPCRW